MKNSTTSTFNFFSSAILGGCLVLLGGCFDRNNDNTAAIGNSKYRGFNEEVHAVADAGNGSLYVGGHFSAFNHQTAQGLARVSKDGSLDRSFATGTGFDNAVYAIASARDGGNYLYVGGDFSRYNGAAVNNIVRINSDGSYDASFSIGTGFDSRVEVIAPAIDGSGDIYVGGHFTRYNGVATNRLVRLNRDGTVDKVFSAGKGANGIVRAIVPANDGSGDIYVAGDFTSYDDIGLQHIARLNADGTVDTAFNPGTGFDREVFALALANDNSHDIYAGGWFQNYNDQSARYLTRLTETGEINSRFKSRDFDGEGVQYVTSLVTADNCSGSVYVGGSFTRYGDKAVNGLVLLNGKGKISSRFPQTAIPEDAMVNSMVADIKGDLYVGGWLTPLKGKQPNVILRLRDESMRDSTYSNRRWQQPIESVWHSDQTISLAELVL